MTAFSDETVLKRNEVLSFDDGLLTIKISGHGAGDGWGSIAFHERQIEIDADGFHIAEIPPSELRALRDFLNRVIKPAFSDETGGEALESPQHIVEGIILRRLHDKRIEGYTLEMSKEIAAALSASPVGEPLRRIVLDTLNAVAPAVENLSVHQEQCDRDGVMVKVSRQALDEVLNAVNEVAMQSAITTSPASPVAQEPVAKMTFTRAMDIAERGFKTWRSKPHNAKWFKRIDGTPIPNDLLVNIAEAFCHDEA